MKNLLIVPLILLVQMVWAQSGSVTGMVKDDKGGLPYTNIYLKGTGLGTTSDSTGFYNLKDIPAGDYQLIATHVTQQPYKTNITIASGQHIKLDIQLKSDNSQLNMVVVTGTLKPVAKLESPVPIDVYSPKFFKSNPTPSVYEAMQNVNGVRPQINCAVCNTGDIHINGLEGAYTMVMIDGMPIVSGLSTVYGLSGIPQSLIERIEIVKGPASTLYGSEAVGGLINVITKKPINAPIISGDAFTTSWGEVNADISGKYRLGKKVEGLIGLNYFNFQNRIDNNGDNFTDLTLQDRISVFGKWNIQRKYNRIFSLAGRYVYEDRFGGELNWNKSHRGGEDVYGESIYTDRWEVFGVYQLPLKERILFSFSANEHNQNSVYGSTWYVANQRIGFGQLTWTKKLGHKHDMLFGSAMRYTYYDDNTPATANSDSINPMNNPSVTYLPGVFIQDEIAINPNNKLLLGMRYDHNSIHGNIFTPRFNYKWNSRSKLEVIRLSFGTGYRVANVFTEDHAALTGARDVVFEAELKPETSLNGNLNFVKKVFTDSDWNINLDASLFYTHFNNKIIADYITDVNKIIYDNIDEHAVSKGFSLNLDASRNNFSLIAGATVMDVYSVEEGRQVRQLLTEQFTATWNLGYELPELNLKLDYSGNVYGPMLLPTLGETDPRPEMSPWWSIQNIQITKTLQKKWEVYAGVKNLLNWTPWKQLNTDLIARPHDPFDKNVSFDGNGNVIPTDDNPYGLTFDPSYIYAPNQGIRTFVGLRYSIQKY